MENGCSVCKRCGGGNCVSKIPVFSSLDFNEQDKIHSLIIRKKYRKGEFLLMEGDIQESLTILHHGKVKVFRYTQEDKEQILYVLSEGDFFGERNLFQKLKSTCFIEALEETEVCLISDSAFIAFLKNHPEIGEPGGSHTRRLIFQRYPYTVVYRLKDEALEIVALAHHSRQPEYWAGRL